MRDCEKNNWFENILAVCGVIPIVSTATSPINVIYGIGYEVVAPFRRIHYNRKASNAGDEKWREYKHQAWAVGQKQGNGYRLIIKGIFFNPYPIVGNIVNGFEECLYHR